MYEDTIVAISTPIGEGGIGVVRISGKDARAVVAKVFAQGLRHRRLSYGKIIDPRDGAVLDEVMATFVRDKKFWLYTKIGLDRILGPTTHAFQVPRRFGPIRIVTPGFVSAAHRRGIEVHVWTVNDPEEMVELIEMGIDGIITDYPTRLRAVMAELGMPLPRAYHR